MIPMNSNPTPSNAAISSRILRAVAESGSLRLGYDAVMGNGAYDKLGMEIYTELRAAIKTTAAVEAVQS